MKKMQPSHSVSLNAGISRRKALGLGAAVAAGTLLSLDATAATAKRKVVVWSEGTAPKDVYPNDINGAIAEGLKPLSGWDIVVANLKDPNQGLSEELLNQTDVLIWWGHQKHDDVKDELVARIVKRVKEDGMGFISLHSSHFAKPNKRLMGTACSWGEYTVDGSTASVIVQDSKHPIAKGVTNFELGKTEVYGEPYKVPTPEAVVFDGIFHRPGGKEEHARHGLCWTIGKGRMFYFQGGHETCPHYYIPQVQLLMRNAVQWAAPKK